MIVTVMVIMIMTSFFHTSLSTGNLKFLNFRVSVGTCHFKVESSVDLEMPS